MVIDDVMCYTAEEVLGGASLFGVTPDNPFCGTFYYERTIIGKTGKD